MIRFVRFPCRNSAASCRRERSGWPFHPDHIESFPAICSVVRRQVELTMRAMNARPLLLHASRLTHNAALGVLFLLAPMSAPGAVPANGQKGIASTVNSLATEAAVAAMKNGGNAVDAAVAAALTLGVVDGFNSGIGGGCFLLIRRADGSVVAIDGREKAPAAATRDM